MRFTSCNPALGVLTIPFISLSKPVDPNKIVFALSERQRYITKVYLCNFVTYTQKTFQMALKIAIIKERKNPPDKRVVFSPEKCQEVIQHFPDANIKVESSDIRVFPDSAYREKGIEVTEDVSDCDVLLGVKEVPVEA